MLDVKIFVLITCILSMLRSQVQIPRPKYFDKKSKFKFLKLHVVLFCKIKIEEFFSSLPHTLAEKNLMAKY